MKNLRTRNLALLLPMFYEFAREIREGVVEWANRNREWRLVELHLDEVRAKKSLAGHLDGVVYWPGSEHCRGWDVLSKWNVPTVLCGGKVPTGTDIRKIASLTFDRGSVSRLAVEHFSELGFEVVGYVGKDLVADGQISPRVALMRAAALARGMEWVSHDIGDMDPEEFPDLLWEGSRSSGLRDFLEQCPKPVALLAEDDYIGTMVCETAGGMGIPVPSELAVLGQGNRLVGQAGGIPLSSVILPGRKVGRMAAELIQSWQESELKSPSSRLVPCEGIAVRRSTGGLSCDPNIERAKRFLDRNLLTGVSVGQLAIVSGYSPKTLRQKLMELHGINVASFARARRCEEIVRMIRETDLSLAEIGRRCGFDSPSGFCNFVSRNSGMTPAEHRGIRPGRSGREVGEGA